MVKSATFIPFWPGQTAPALFLLAMFAAAFGSLPAAAQTSQPPVAAQPVPGELELSKLIWTIMAAVDHANMAGNYSVLRDLAAPGFQANNDAASLAQIFQSIRESRVRLSNTLLLAPTYTAAPLMQGGVMRVQGFFGLRPTAISFDLHYQWVNGRWRLFGISIAPRTIATIQPEGGDRRSGR